MNNNAKLVFAEIEAQGYKLGCWDSLLNALNRSNLKKVIDNIKYQNDTKVFIGRKPYIVMMDEVDNEIDFNCQSLKWYEERFGTWED